MHLRLYDILHKRTYLNRFLLLWVPLTFLLSAIIYSFYLSNVHSNLALLQSSARQSINLATQSSTASLHTVRSDLLFLADLTGQQFSANPLFSSQDLQRIYLDFARRRGNYDQIRLLHPDGKEVIRINWQQDQSEIVPRGNLQNKSSRYYVDACKGLAKGETYVSHLDLNIEHETLEIPLKPTLRFCTPVFDHKDKLAGLLIVNYLGQKLLDRIRFSGSAAGKDAEIWLMNTEGYWLLGRQPDDSWGFMFPDRHDRKLESLDKQAWNIISNSSPQGQFQNERGMYTYSRLNPYEMANISQTSVVVDEQWYLVSFTSASSLAASTARLAYKLWLVFLLLEAVQSGAAILLTHFSVRKKLAETAVKDNEARYRSLLDSAPDSIIIVNRQGLIELVNNQTEKIFGYKRESLLMQPVEILLPESVRIAHREYRKEYYDYPRVRPMGEGMDLLAKRKDGTMFPVEVSLSPLDTPNGRLVTAIIRDITPRKQAEALHQESQERFRDLVSNLPIGVYRKTPDSKGSYLEVNPALVAMLEAGTAENLLKHNVSNFYFDPSQRQKFVDKIMQQEFVAAEEVEMITLRGKRFWAAITAVRKVDRQGKVYIDGVVEDISERKLIQQQLQELNDSLSSRSHDLEIANRELEAFSYSVSHDLRAPLRAVDGFSQILQREYAAMLDDKGRNFLDRIRRAAQHMGNLIDDLLKLSRVTRAELCREEVDLSELSTQLMHDLDTHDPAHVINFNTRAGIVAHGDKRLLQIVLTNLLGNAVKFSSKLPVAQIEFGVSGVNGATVYYVRDNGAGFDNNFASKLFGVFQRLHDASEFPGTGIGLATAQRIIHKHNGSIWAVGEPGKGATFYFTLDDGAMA